LIRLYQKYNNEIKEVWKWLQLKLLILTSK
jgi:hypothetical protein